MMNVYNKCTCVDLIQITEQIIRARMLFDLNHIKIYSNKVLNNDV